MNFKYKGFLPNHRLLGCLEGCVRSLIPDTRASVVIPSPYFESYNSSSHIVARKKIESPPWNLSDG